MSSSRFTDVCIMFCMGFAAMRRFRYCIRIKIQGGRYRLIKRLTIRHILLGGIAVLALVYLFYLLRLNGQTQDILNQLNRLLAR